MELKLSLSGWPCCLFEPVSKVCPLKVSYGCNYKRSTQWIILACFESRSTGVLINMTEKIVGLLVLL